MTDAERLEHAREVVEMALNGKRVDTLVEYEVALRWLIRQAEAIQRVEALEAELIAMSGGSTIGWEMGRDYCVEHLREALDGYDAGA